MALAISEMDGAVYDDAAPRFIDINADWVFDRVMRRLLRASSLDDAVTAGRSLGPNERGNLPAGFYGEQDYIAGMPAEDFVAANGGTVDGAGGGGNGGGGGDPAEAPITATANLGGMTVTLAGGPSDAAATLTITYQVDSSGSDVTVTQAIAEGDDIDTVATSAAAQITGALTATASGGVITVALGTATSLDALSASVA